MYLEIYIYININHNSLLNFEVYPKNKKVEKKNSLIWQKKKKLLFLLKHQGENDKFEGTYQLPICKIWDRKITL